MKLYLAAHYARRDELKEYARAFESAGHQVTSRWLTSEQVDAIHETTTSIPIEARGAAQEDYDDLAQADVLVSFTDPPRKGATTRGGRHVEFGLAMAWNKTLILIGPRENIFHCLPQVKHFWEWGPDVVRGLSQKGTP